MHSDETGMVRGGPLWSNSPAIFGQGRIIYNNGVPSGG